MQAAHELKLKQTEQFYDMERTNNAQLEKTIAADSFLIAELKTDLRKVDMACTDILSQVWLIFLTKIYLHVYCKYSNDWYHMIWTIKMNV